MPYAAQMLMREGEGMDKGAGAMSTAHAGVTGTDPEEPFFRVSAAEARRLIGEGDAQVVDVRLPREYAGGHIAGAVNIHVDDLFKHHMELSLDRDIVVVCRIGVISALGAEILALLGGKRIHNLEGGMEEWVRCGFPVETPAPANAHL